jgi:two-component system NtrC family response regulator
MAEGGTLFLDEIGELPTVLQVKLLRFLQEKTIERIGGRQQIEVDARVLAATNRNLEEAIKNGSFREDLYYRLNVIRINLPPLRDRQTDILLLAKTFLDRYCQENRKKIKDFSKKAVNAIESYAWPGNVRELENRVKRAVIMSDGKKISLEDLEMESLDIETKRMTLKDAREDVEKKLIIKAIARNDNNLSKAAADLGISRPTLYDMMDKLEIPRPGEQRED